MHSWLPLWLPKEIKSIVTIHDLFAITDPLFFIHRKPFHNMVRRYFKCLLARTLKHSSAVVTISQYCKKEIEQNFNFSKPIEVIYNSPGLVSENFKKQNHVDMNEKYLFYLGNFRSYKNVEVLLRGFRLFLQMRPNVNIKLVLAGNDLGDSMKILSKQLSIEECVKFIYKPSDEQICSLYQNSVAFIFPSKYEGFGIPPLEAMSFGIPVIISDADALVETSGSAAAIFDRNDPQGLAKTICKVIEDDCFRVQLIESGYRTYKLYNWNTSAVQLLRFYEVIMSNNY
jgi:glycosyltransferase involved in cell wall biosynthesis